MNRPCGSNAFPFPRKLGKLLLKSRQAPVMASMPFSVDIRDPTLPRELPVHLSLSTHIPNVLTRGLYWPPRRAAPPTTVLLFVCGFVLVKRWNRLVLTSAHCRNPGIPGWYIEFINTIRQEASSSSLAFLAVGHIGHAYDLPQPEDIRSLSLQSQVEAARYTQNALLEAFPNASLILAGHSIGGYIAMEVSSFHT